MLIFICQHYKHEYVILNYSELSNGDLVIYFRNLLLIHFLNYSELSNGDLVIYFGNLLLIHFEMTMQLLQKSPHQT